MSLNVTFSKMRPQCVNRVVRWPTLMMQSDEPFRLAASRLRAAAVALVHLGGSLLDPIRQLLKDRLRNRVGGSIAS